MNPAPQSPSPTAPGLAAWLADPAPTQPDAAPAWLVQERQRARERLAREPLPDARQETWRYTNPRPLLERPFQVGGPAPVPPHAEDLEPLAIPGLDAYRVVLVNGRLAQELSQLQALPPGVRGLSLDQALAQEPDLLAARVNGVAGDGAHLFAALNGAELGDGLLLILEPGVILDRPIELLHLAVPTDSPQLAQPRHLLTLGRGAAATLIERYVSLTPERHGTNSLLEIELGPAARLEHHRLQEEGPQACHLSGLYLRQGGDSRYRATQFSLGAGWSRTDLSVGFAGRGAECEIDGLYLAGDRQLTGLHLDVRHQVPGCVSRQHLKGILHGAGRAVLDGRIRVDPDAQHTDAQLRNANLLLSRDAEVDSKPQLEIYADDVRCSHGATVGQLDPDGLFYLRARGIDTLEAQRLLCMGFAEEILDRCALPPLREHVSARVGALLDGALRAATPDNASNPPC